MSKADFQFDAPGANPFATPTALRSNVATGSDGSGYSQPPFALGTVLRGRFKSEFVLVQATFAAVTTIPFGAAFQFDKDFNATLLSTTSGTQALNVGHAQFQAINLAPGTYWFWLGQAGNLAVAMTGSAGSTIAETTATPGVLNFPAGNTPTTGAKSVVAEGSYMASKAFAANTTTGSAVLTGVSNADLNDLNVGAAISGTGIPAGSVIASITQLNGQNIVTMTNGVGGAAANATATGAGVTVTATGVLTGNVVWPYVGRTN